MGNDNSSAAGPGSRATDNTYQRTSVRTPAASPPVAPQRNNTVRCPTCRRLLQPPAGHQRFQCPCGQSLMSPAPTDVQHVKCPRCNVTLQPPPGVPVFRCVCGVALRAPNPTNLVPRGSSARGIAAPPSTGATGTSAVNQPGGGKFEDENLLPDEVIANTLMKPNEEHWLRNTSRDGALHWVRLLSQEQEQTIQKLQKNMFKDMDEKMPGMDPTTLAERLQKMGLDTSDALGKDDLMKMLKNSASLISGWPLDKIKGQLDKHNTDYADCQDEAEYVERLVAMGWYGEASFSDGFVRQFVDDFTCDIIPASKYILDTEFGKYRISNLEIENVSQLSFKKKVEWFRKQCQNAQIRWEDGRVMIKIRRSELLRDSFNNFNRLKPNDLRRYLRFEFIGEEGVDAGGVAREWFELVTDACFNVDCGLFEYSGVDNICYQINPASGVANDLHEQYFHFLGRVVGKALFDHKFIRAHVTQPIYKHILGWPITMKDIQFSDARLYQSLVEMQNADDVSEYYLTFTHTLEVFGETHEVLLKPGGGEIEVTNSNLQEYIHLMTQYMMFERTKVQLAHFLRGIYDVIPPVWLSVFDYRELELLLCGLPNINVQDWKKNTKYRGQYAAKGEKHKVVKWFWEVVEASTQEQRALILQFCTGTSRVPVQGFEALQGNDGNIKPFTIDSANIKDIVYPKAHTCFNRIELPMYRTKEEMIKRFEEALQQGATGFSDE